MAAKWENFEELAEAIERAEGVELERIKVRLLLQLAMSGIEMCSALRRLSLIAPPAGGKVFVAGSGGIYRPGQG